MWGPNLFFGDGGVLEAGGMSHHVTEAGASCAACELRTLNDLHTSRV